MSLTKAVVAFYDLGAALECARTAQAEEVEDQGREPGEAALKRGCHAKAMSLTPLEWVQVLTAVAIATAAAFQGVFMAKTYALSRRATQAYVFVRLREPEPGIIVENTGGGVAWNGGIQLEGVPSRYMHAYQFTRLYEKASYDFPATGHGEFPAKYLDDDELKITLRYGLKEGRRHDRKWEAVLRVPASWTQRQKFKIP